MSYLIDTVDGQKDVETKSYIGDVLVLNTSDGDYVYDNSSQTHIPYDAEAIEASKSVGGGAGESETTDATEAAEALADHQGINAGHVGETDPTVNGEESSETVEGSAIWGSKPETGEETTEETA